MIGAETSGQGVPLLFLHGFPLPRQMWAANKAAFSKNFRFVAVDLPGFGESPNLEETSSMEKMAASVLEKLDELGIKEKVVLSGVSMGGYVLFQLLRTAPERIRAVGLISTRASADTPEIRARRMKTIEMIQTDGNLKGLSQKMIPQLFGVSSLSANLPVVQQVQNWIENAPPKGVIAALRGMAERPDSTEILSQINVPTLVVSGAEDVFVPSTEMEAMANRVKNVEFHVLPKSGHLLTLERPDIFNELFLRFLKRRVL